MSGRKGSPSGPKAAFNITLTGLTIDSAGNASPGFMQSIPYTGVRAGDIVIPNNDSLPIPNVAAVASRCSTPGFIDINFQNWTGAPVNAAGCVLSFLVIPN